MEPAVPRDNYIALVVKQTTSLLADQADHPLLP